MKLHTRLSDREDPVPDAIWSEAARHYDEQSLAALVVQIALINSWNRLNAAVGQMAGVELARREIYNAADRTGRRRAAPT